MLSWKEVEPSRAPFKRMKTIPHLNLLPLRKGEATAFSIAALTLTHAMFW
jgi:hypothetical protein